MPSQKRVCFSEISIRTFNVCIGDSPSVSSGVPLTLDWSYCELPDITVDEFEGLRPERRTNDELKLSPEDRLKILLEFGVSPAEIRTALRRTLLLRGKRSSFRQGLTLRSFHPKCQKEDALDTFTPLTGIPDLPRRPRNSGPSAA
jgi:hypothetical protein